MNKNKITEHLILHKTQNVERKNSLFLSTKVYNQ